MEDGSLMRAESSLSNYDETAGGAVSSRSASRASIRLASSRPDALNRFRAGSMRLALENVRHAASRQIARNGLAEVTKSIAPALGAPRDRALPFIFGAYADMLQKAAHTSAKTALAEFLLRSRYLLHGTAGKNAFTRRDISEADEFERAYAFNQVRASVDHVGFLNLRAWAAKEIGIDDAEYTRMFPVVDMSETSEAVYASLDAVIPNEDPMKKSLIAPFFAPQYVESDGTNPRIPPGVLTQNRKYKQGGMVLHPSASFNTPEAGRERLFLRLALGAVRSHRAIRSESEESADFLTSGDLNREFQYQRALVPAPDALNAVAYGLYKDLETVKKLLPRHASALLDDRAFRNVLLHATPELSMTEPTVQMEGPQIADHVFALKAKIGVLKERAMARLGRMLSDEPGNDAFTPRARFLTASGMALALAVTAVAAPFAGLMNTRGGAPAFSYEDSRPAPSQARTPRQTFVASVGPIESRHVPAFVTERGTPVVFVQEEAPSFEVEAETEELLGAPIPAFDSTQRGVPLELLSASNDLDQEELGPLY